MSILLIGSKNYSSWSLRPWVFLRKAAFEFTEQIVYFDESDYRRRSRQCRRRGAFHCSSTQTSKSGIRSRSANTPPRKPAAIAARSISTRKARSVAAEMHSGFQALRNECPMNVRARERRVPLTPELQTDMARIDQIWSGCRKEYGHAGNWLFGDFSIADAMFAPVVFRFQTYGATLSPASTGICATHCRIPTCAPGETQRGGKVIRCPELSRSAPRSRCEYN